MRSKDIRPITIDSIVKECEVLHINDDVALMSSLKVAPKQVEPRRLSLCLFIGLCTAGNLTMSVNDKVRSVGARDVFIVTEESVVNDINMDENFDGIGFFVSYKLLQEILRDIRSMSDLFLLSHNHPVFNLTPEEVKVGQIHFDNISKRILQEGHRFRLEVVRLMLLMLIYDMSNAFDRTLVNTDKEDKQSRSERLFVQFVQIVEHHFREQRQVQWYAKQMGVTPKYLCEVISSVSRRSPNEWIDKFVTSEIRNQLRHTTKKISEIAQEMNFPTQSFFGKYFKDNVGVSPTEYRNGVEGKKRK